MKSDVYLVKTNGKDIKERIGSLLKLLRETAPFSGYKKDEFIPVKITIGDTKCTHHLNPEIVKSVITLANPAI